jgi:hypothetical protein
MNEIYRGYQYQKAVILQKSCILSRWTAVHHTSDFFNGPLHAGMATCQLPGCCRGCDTLLLPSISLCFPTISQETQSENVVQHVLQSRELCCVIVA